MENNVIHESTPLLQQEHHDRHSFGSSSVVGVTEGGERENPRGHASFGETVVTMVKTCMGSATVGLPFACHNGGCIVYCTGMIAIAIWNAISVQRLCKCLEFLPDEELSLVPVSANTRDTDLIEDDRIRKQSKNQPPAEITLLGKVAWHSFGSLGLFAFDIVMMTLFFGIIVAYQTAIVSFFSDTPLSLGPLADSLLGATIIGCFSLVPDLGYLTRASAAGMLVLAATFMVVVVDGLIQTDFADLDARERLPLWPKSMNGLSNWFGVSVFGYGIVPLTYNYREGMREPARLLEASFFALLSTAAAYVTLGICLLLLYPDTKGEILHELPKGVVPMVTRLAMTSVILVTAPLLVVPCCELLEGKFRITSSTVSSLLRFCIVYSAAVLAWLLPSFVVALGFVGSACVGTVSFCLPPLFHARLSVLSGNSTASSYLCLLDYFLVLWGLTATILSSYCIFHLKHLD